MHALDSVSFTGAWPGSASAVDLLLVVALPWVTSPGCALPMPPGTLCCPTSSPPVPPAAALQTGSRATAAARHPLTACGTP